MKGADELTLQSYNVFGMYAAKIIISDGKIHQTITIDGDKAFQKLLQIS